MAELSCKVYKIILVLYSYCAIIPCPIPCPMKISVKFYLRPSTTKMSAFKCKIFYGAKNPLTYSVGEKVETKHWSQNRQRCKEVQTYPEGHAINELLDRITSAASEAANTLSDQDRTPAAMRQEIDKLLSRSIERSDKSIHDIYLILSDRAESEGRRRHFRSKLNQFKQFEKWQIENRKIAQPYQWHQFKFRDTEDFKHFLVDVKEYSPNSIGDQIKILKRVFRYARKLGLHENDIAEDKDFKAPMGVAADAPALTKEEILRFRDADCDTALQELVRDVFYMQCILCLRFSDSGLDVGQIHQKNGAWFVRKRSFKTLTKAVMRCPQSVIDILQKYDWNPPSYPSNPVTNRILKMLAERAQIDDKFTYMQQKGNAKKLVTKYKYEMVSTHTARRSAATNMILDGIPPDLVALFGGWSTVGQMMDYVKIDNEKRAYELIDHPYFKGFD